MRSLRASAVVAAGAGVSHLVVASLDPAHPLMVVTMVALAGLCLPCAVALWRRSTEHAATAMLFMTVVMILAHTASLSTHDHSGSASSAATPAPAVGAAAFTVIPLLLELAVTVQLAYWLRRRHRTDARTTTIHLNREIAEPQ